MVDKLSVQIELQGGAEIERQLEGIGQAGKKAFADISASAEQVGGFKNIKPEEVTAKLQEMGITGVDAIDQIQKAVQTAGRFEALVGGITSIETAFATLARAAPVVGTAIVAAMVAAAKSTIAFAEAVNKVNNTAITLGTGVAQLDRFRAGLQQAGVSAESLAEILKSKLALEQGLPGLEAFIQSLERMPDSAARSKAAVEQFNQAGAELIRILQAGGSLTGFGPPGGLINAQDAQRATELGMALNRLESAIGRLNGLAFAPALTVGINAAISGIQVLGSRLQNTPWTSFMNAASLGLSPIASAISTINGGLTLLGGTVETVGGKVQKGVQIWTQWGTAAEDGSKKATVAVNATGTATTDAGQKAVQMWTQWGTAAGEAATKTNNAKGALEGINWSSIQSMGVKAWNAITGAIQVAIEKLLEYSGLLAKGSTGRGAPGGGGGPVPGGASGGLLGGRGTGTSDSNLIRVSRGEFITPARAVAQPGVLAFLEALRRSGGDLSRVLNGMGRFALGGMVPRAIPAFAAGGLAGGGNHVTIQFPGLPAIGGLRASSDVVDQLQRAAALAQVRSGGRKPSRYS